METAVLSIGILGGQMEIQANRKYTYWDNFMCNTQFHVYALICLSDHPRKIQIQIQENTYWDNFLCMPISE